MRWYSIPFLTFYTFAMICTVRLINKTEMNLLLEVTTEEDSDEKSNGYQIRYELGKNMKIKLLYKCTDTETVAKVSFMGVSDGNFEKYPGSSGVFHNQTYLVLNSWFSTVGLQLQDDFVNDEQDLKSEIFSLQKQLKSLEETVNRISHERTPGPPGAQGPRGEPGPAGPQGPPGTTLCQFQNSGDVVDSEQKPVLLLSTSRKENVPLVIVNSTLTEKPDFKIEDSTEVAHSCSVMFQNQMLIYGGVNQRQQISKVVGCSLKRVASLPFELYYGACGVGGDQIYLCFNASNRNDYKKCRRSADPLRNFEEIALSTFEHREIRAATSTDLLFTAGSFESSNEQQPYSNKAEMFSFSKNEWITIADYPFSKQLYLAPVLYKFDSFFVVGGYTGRSSTDIARFSLKTETWIFAGALNHQRHGHGVIGSGSGFLVVGGYGKPRTLPTEKCHINTNDEVECVTQKPKLYYYLHYPEMFHVTENFCM